MDRKPRLPPELAADWDLSSEAGQTELPVALGIALAEGASLLRPGLRILGSDPHPGLFPPHWPQHWGAALWT